MKYNYVTIDCTNPYRNLAYEQSLFEFVEPGQAILFLWQNDNTIVVGRNQDVYKECLVEEFMKNGGRIARRRSGGGAVYHDMGNLNFSIICAEPEAQECAYQKVIKKAVKKFGIDAEFNGRNDLVIDGRKFSGNAAYSDGKILCQHGTILIASDMNRMNDYLTPDASKLGRNHVKSVSSRVINLGCLAEGICVDSMKRAMVSEVDAAPMKKLPSDDVVKGLEMFYSDKNWIFGGEK